MRRRWPSRILRAPAPKGEDLRIRALRSLLIPDIGNEERFYRIDFVAQSRFEVPVALFSLVDSDRQWFKWNQGLGADETPRELSLRGHTILSD
jgi:hypothetical protein